MEIWRIIKTLQGKTIKTLDRKRLFDISSVNRRGVVVVPHVSGKGRYIKRSTIEDVFSELRARGELPRSDIQNRYSSFNPAYVAALLAEHPDVEYRLRPIVLHFRK